MLNVQLTDTLEQNLSIDAYAYDLGFEKILTPELKSFFAVLDYVASRIQAGSLSRILTKIEHSYLVKSQMAIRLGSAFNLGQQHSRHVAACLLLSGAKKSSYLLQGADADTILFSHAFSKQLIEDSDRFAEWHDTGNLIDFMESRNDGIESRQKALHYLCQLIVFTFTPKDPSEMPESLIVSPERYFSLSNIWANRPELYDTGLALSASGKKILYKELEAPAVPFRKNLGILADLHLEMATKLWQECQDCL